MRRVAALMVLSGLACAPSEPKVNEGTRADGLFTGSVLANGPPDSGLGTLVVRCGAGFLAAGPNAVWFNTNSLPSPGVLTAIECGGPLNAPVPMLGGSGIWRLNTSYWVALDPLNISAMTQSSDGVLAAGGGKIIKLESSFGVAATRNATALAYYPSALGGNLVALDTAAQTVTPFQNLSYVAMNSIGPLQGHVFKDVLAVGRFHPGSAWQIAVGTTAGHVLLLNPNGGALLMDLQGTTPSFGASLAVRPNAYPSIDGLYVGEPDLDAVHFMVGDAGLELASIDGGRFGAALAVSRGGELAIGAPLAGPGGTVFVQNVRASSLVGTPTICTSGAQCRGPSACTVGTCLGGVVCDALRAGCLQGEACVQSTCVALADAGQESDAGAPDAGVDAGSPDPSDAGVDAGSPDAGEQRDAGVDAGFPDAGRPDEETDAGSSGNELVVFSTRSCSSSGALPWLTVALVVLRRRAQQRR